LVRLTCSPAAGSLPEAAGANLPLPGIIVVEIILPAVVVEVAAIRVEELALAVAFTPRVEEAAAPEAAFRPRVVGAAVPEAFTQPVGAAVPLTLLLVPPLCTLLLPLAEQRVFRVLPLAEHPMFRRVPDKRGRLLARRPSLVRRSLRKPQSRGMLRLL